MTADFLESFLREPPQIQDAIIEQERELDRLKARRDELEKLSLEQLEQRWAMVPQWRRAVILAAQWVQVKFTPKYF